MPKSDRARPLLLGSTRHHERDLVQPVAPRVAYRRAQSTPVLSHVEASKRLIIAVLP
jgi:hypothetical protein